jgi:flagellar hook-associated protein 2
MAGIQAGGIGSGLDVGSLVKQLVSAERAPLDARIARRESAATVEISALATVKGSLGSLRDSLGTLRDLSSFASRTATTSSTEHFLASATSAVLPGSYDVEIANLASAHKLASAAFAGGRDAVVGTGTLTVSTGGETFNVTVDGASNTLVQIRDAINAATGNDSVTASILNETGGARLILTARATGAANAITVTQSGGDGGLAALVYDAAAPAANTLSQTTAAADALVRINGYDYTSASNTVTGAVDGLTITLLKADFGVQHTLTVANDMTAVQSKIRKFVTDYNALAKTFSTMQAYDPATGRAGPLIGDALVRGLESQLRRALTGSVTAASGDYKALAEFGITTDIKGQLQINDAKLSAALNADFDGVAQVFAADGGVAVGMYETLAGALDSAGQLANRQDGLNALIKSISVDKEKVNYRMQSVEARYRAQFTALDSLLAQMQSTGNYLTQQLSAIAKSG